VVTRIHRPRRSIWLGLAVAAVALTLPGGQMTLALATDTETVAATITADTLNPPTNLQCTGLPSCTVTFLTKPTLTWTATPDTYATGYQVWRSTTSGSGYTQVASVTPRTTTTWTDTTVSPLTTYYYVVRAVANSWTSAFSNQVQATVLA
jgi:predicted phage tail protein